MNIKSLFFGKKKKKKEEEEVPIVYPTKPNIYRMGYEIHTMDGAIHKKYFDKVPEDQRESVRNAIDADVKKMENALNIAATKKKDFVNLGGCVFRMKDFSKISVFDTIDIN